MDPTACLNEIVEMIIDPDRVNSEVREKIDDLQAWLEKGGAKPKIPSGRAALVRLMILKWSHPLHWALFDTEAK